MSPELYCVTQEALQLRASANARKSLICARFASFLTLPSARSSPPPPKPSKPWQRTSATWGRVVVDSLAFCTPGGGSCSVTRIFTTSFRAVLSTQNRAAGTAHAMPFSCPEYACPVQTISRKFLTLMKASDLYALIPESVWLQVTRVECQLPIRAQRGCHAQLFGTLSIEELELSHRAYRLNRRLGLMRRRKVGSQRNRIMIVDAVEFMRRFLNHVLPSGFMKIRYFGFLGSSSKITLEQVHLSIQLASAFELKPPTTTRKTTSPARI